MEAIRTHRPLHRNVQQPENIKRNIKRTAPERTYQFPTDGILRTQFLPIVKEAQQLEDWQKKARRISSPLFQNLCAHYKNSQNRL